jgi:hypothetical protein
MLVMLLMKQNGMNKELIADRWAVYEAELIDESKS